VPPRNNGKRKKKQSKPHIFKRRRRNPETGELMPLPGVPPSEEGDANGNESGGGEDDENDGEAANLAVQAVVEGLGEKEYEVGTREDGIDENSVQILDLHTKNPLIAYRGTIYSCKWATTMGTDMFFGKQKEEESGSPQALINLKGWDLMGLSSARLLATEARLSHRVAQEEKNKDELQQSSFLHKFLNIQLKKGEVATAESVADGTPLADNVPMAEPDALRALFLGPPVSRHHARKNKDTTKTNTAASPEANADSPEGMEMNENNELG
jgi:hypothetical protein